MVAFSESKNDSTVLQYIDDGPVGFLSLHNVTPLLSRSVIESRYALPIAEGKPITQEILTQCLLKIQQGRNALLDYFEIGSHENTMTHEQEKYLSHSVYLAIQLTPDGDHCFPDYIEHTNILLRRYATDNTIEDLISNQPELIIPVEQGLEAEQALVYQFERSIEGRANYYEYRGREVGLEYEDFYTACESAFRRAVRNSDPFATVPQFINYALTAMNNASREVFDREGYHYGLPLSISADIRKLSSVKKAYRDLLQVNEIDPEDHGVLQRMMDIHSSRLRFLTLDEIREIQLEIDDEENMQAQGEIALLENLDNVRRFIIQDPEEVMATIAKQRYIPEIPDELIQRFSDCIEFEEMLSFGEFKILTENPDDFDDGLRAVATRLDIDSRDLKKMYYQYREMAILILTLHDLNFTEIAEMFDISRERVSTIHKKFARELKEIFNAPTPTNAIITP